MLFEHTVAYLDFHELVCVELVDVLEVIEILLQHVQLVTESADFATKP